MTDIRQQCKALMERVLDGAGTASRSERQAAFANAAPAEPVKALIEKVATQPAAVTDRDIAAVRASGLTEDQIFELVICAALGQSTRQYECARAALKAATGEG